MRDNPNLMTGFVKIIQKYPEIYDPNMDTYRTRFSEMAWTKVAAHVRNELHEDCTIDELKARWKGIRSSFTRYKSKLTRQSGDNFHACKKYYLYDHLRFLDPFLRITGPNSEDNENSENPLNATFLPADDNEETNNYCIVEDWETVVDIKPDVSNTKSPEREASQSTSDPSCSEGPKKRKYSSEGPTAVEEDNDDLKFFKSILPDIKNFSNREKRKLKMGILQLIDEIEKEKEE
ncbi:hypothetical protein B5X24_HaOG216667 [Helicoverpa armigera]|nr:hypothetical protein B5X24_HaOG216667 [Helicoverpa armigera]